MWFAYANDYLASGGGQAHITFPFTLRPCLFASTLRSSATEDGPLRQPPFMGSSGELPGSASRLPAQPGSLGLERLLAACQGLGKG